jgi:hypothetical protein
VCFIASGYSIPMSISMALALMLHLRFGLVLFCFKIPTHMLYEGYEGYEDVQGWMGHVRCFWDIGYCF